MEPLSWIFLWILIGFFLNYRWEMLPFKAGDPDGTNGMAIIIFLLSPLFLVASLIYVIFIQEWKL